MQADISIMTRIVKAPVEWMEGRSSIRGGLHGGSDTRAGLRRVNRSQPGRDEREEPSR